MLKYVIYTVVLLLSFAQILSAQQTMQDVVYLKNGSVIRGQIIEQIPNVTIKIQTRDGSIFVYKIEEIEKITKESIKKEEIKELKSPGLAFVMSFLVPGLGQIYNGQAPKGIVQFIMVATGAALAINGVKREWGWNSYTHSSYVISTELKPEFWFGSALYAVTWLWSWVDAPTSATRINMAQRQDQGYLFEYRKKNYGLGFDIGPYNRGIEAKVTFHY